MALLNRLICFCALLLCWVFCPLYSQNTDTAGYRASIAAMIAADDSLGTIRNHACVTLSLSQTIRDYADALGNLDFSNCPGDFAQAFDMHRQAWLAIIPVVENYPGMRGEMHDLFSQLEVSADSAIFRIRLAAIWDTWGAVEAAME